MLQLGVNAVGVTNQRLLSPTRAIIDGRETILAGTNNYMGITFDPDCIAAGKRRSTSSVRAPPARASPTDPTACTSDLEAELARFLDRKHCIVFTTGYQANLGMMSGLAGPRDTIYLDADFAFFHL